MTWLCILYLLTKFISLQNGSHCPQELSGIYALQRSTRSHGLPSYEINIMIYKITKIVPGVLIGREACLHESM